ncbi:hypothetical protein [Actinokineospora sp. NBRC 105648]|uniref:hypothetical protein n=1 Tax=Actinokineospora sp. NBRC 105648 TaxID=3032206 RepID=UPI0024A4FDAB|nr:hypothetical protein [Actinokineospora sp. NBRC 105648]GLZ43789.1 hypothetical protein Acsp05_74130 [Actinokineospora sp. NBRC 105648]
MKDRLKLLPAATLQACQRAVAIAGNEMGDIRTSRAATSRDVITTILRLYRQGDPRTRTECLDLIDTLTATGAYGLDVALADER